MKPGKNDPRYRIRIEGEELAVLQKLTYMMCEAFGLDRKIEKYKGTRAITLYAWDLDCLDDVLALALASPERHDIQGGQELEALGRLAARLRELRISMED